MVVGENKRASNIMDGIENTGDVRLHDHRLRLKQRFDIVRKLGQGTYGKVQLGINKKTGQEVAIKTIKKCKIETEADLIRIRREVQIMSSVRHPNIVHIYEVFENSEKMILVMEYCSGGELYDYLSQKKVLEEDEARRLFRQIATAVYYCHIHKICHRDLKLENVLLDDTGSAKIADFGLSNVFKETSLLSTFCGSPLYASPEIVKGTPYIGPEVDCWSLGVLLYTLVYGAMPFDGSNFKRLVRQISNGDYYEPKNPSTASPLIRDMLTVDPLKRADIVYICDHPWVNTGCESSCLEVAEALAAQTPVRLDLLLSLAPAAPAHGNSVVVPPERAELGGPDESGADLTSSASMPVEPSNSAEKRILELVAEGGEDAIKPSPTRTIVSAGDNKRKLELAMSASGLQRKKERVASCASIAGAPPALPEEASVPDEERECNNDEPPQPSLKSSATMTIAPAPAQLSKAPTAEIIRAPKDEPKVAKVDAVPDKQEEPKVEDKKPSVTATADKLTSLSLSQPATSPVSPTPAPASAPAPAKPKKLSIGGHVGSFKEQFERRASLTTSPEIKRNVTKPVVSKIAKPKAQSEDRELTSKPLDNGTVRLQQIGIEPSPSASEEPQMHRGGVKKTESEPARCAAADRADRADPADPAGLLQDARRSLQSSMAKLVEERAGEESRRRAARDIISTAIRTGKPPVPYGRSSSAGVASLVSPPSTPPAAAPRAEPKVFRTEAHHRVEDHRPRGVSVERIIPISKAPEDPASPPAPAAPAPAPAPPPHKPTPRLHTPLRRLPSTESGTSEASPSTGEPIKKSAREFIIPIAVEGKGYVTPRQRSLEPDNAPRTPLSPLAHPTRLTRRISSLVSGGESEEEDDTHMHRLRSSRLARAESVSSGEEDEEDEGFHLLTAENLFSTLLHRVRALTQRLNGEEGPGFQHPHSLFNNLHSPFFNSPHLPRRHFMREGWSARELQSPFDSMFASRPQLPRGSKKGRAREGLELSDLDLSAIQLSEREMRALSGLTPALSRRLQRELLAHLPPRAARELRRTLSLSAPAASAPAPARTLSANDAAPPPDTPTDGEPKPPPDTPATDPDLPSQNLKEVTDIKSDSKPDLDDNISEVNASHYCTLPRLRRRSASREVASPVSDVNVDYPDKLDATARSTARSSARDTPDRPLLRKYLSDRTTSLDDTFSSESGSIINEPSYIAAYGSPGLGSFRRHSLRLSSDQPRKRISRFLRSDFYEPEESLYTKHKKEKELETQKILKEIREKRNKMSESVSNGAAEAEESQSNLPEIDPLRKSLSPTGVILGKDRSRSTTPFFPILDNIKENITDTSSPLLKQKLDRVSNELHNTVVNDGDSITNKNIKMARPKSYPAKSLCDDSNKSTMAEKLSKDVDNIEGKQASRESKLLRPKSYPNSNIIPEKGQLNRNSKKEELIKSSSKEISPSPDMKSDIEVSFNITLPKKTKPSVSQTQNTDGVKQKEKSNEKEIPKKNSIADASSNLVLKKYQVLNSIDKSQKVEQKIVNGTNEVDDRNDKSRKNADEVKIENVGNNGIKKDGSNTNSIENEQNNTKVTVKKKIIKKVSSKTKTDLGNSQDSSESKSIVEKKKITKKVKDKTPEDGSKVTTAPKKKSVLQSIGHKLEKFTSSKSNSPEKGSQNINAITSDYKKSNSKLNRTQREHSVPVEPPTESNLIKRAVTITDVAALENQNIAQNKTTVSKVLGLFRKFDPKEKSTKLISEKVKNEVVVTPVNDVNNMDSDNIVNVDVYLDKPTRPSSLLLNGLNRKNKHSKANDDNTSKETEEKPAKNDTEPRNLKNSLKLDFSKLPRVKKIVPTNSVIEPQVMDTSLDKECHRKNIDEEKNRVMTDGTGKLELSDTISRSRSRSRSTYSNSDVRSDQSAEIKDKNPLSPSILRPTRSHESTTPEKEDIVDRIRRKSFYSRFNEKKQRRKSNLVGPGATEYDPIARIYSQPNETKYDVSPTSPTTYDLSPGYSVASDMSPSTERYRSLLSDLPINTRSNLRYDGIGDKVDTYRSLDRNDLRKYSGTRSYLDYDQPLSYSQNRYARTKSLLDSSDGTENLSLSMLREPHKYNRTNSLYSPGNYATYRPKRTRNPAIILKESEKEPSPENILDKIRQRKYSISVTRKPDPDKDSLPRPSGPPKGEGDGTERAAKGD